MEEGDSVATACAFAPAPSAALRAEWKGFWVGFMRPKAEALGYLEAWHARLSCRGEHPDLQVREIGGSRVAGAFGLGGIRVRYPTHPQRTRINGHPAPAPAIGA